ncbi:MAG: hypothetical protein RJA36_1396 [Pseudomonadota bacterium]|jgi:hypothetical protein
MSTAVWEPGITDFYTQWGDYRVCHALTPEGEFYLPFLKGKLIGPRCAMEDQAQAFCESHAARLEDEAQTD